jgi:hypothetical protein
MLTPAPCPFPFVKMCESMLEMVLFLWGIGKEHETEAVVLTGPFWPTDATSSQHNGTRRAQTRLDPPPGDISSSCPAPTLLVHCQCCCGKSICGYIHLRTIGSCALALRYRGIRDRGASAINEQPP